MRGLIAVVLLGFGLSLSACAGGQGGHSGGSGSIGGGTTAGGAGIGVGNSGSIGGGSSGTVVFTNATASGAAAPKHK